MTTIEDAQPFYEAEEYHQDFYKKDPAREAMVMASRVAFQKTHWDDK